MTTMRAPWLSSASSDDDHEGAMDDSALDLTLDRRRQHGSVTGMSYAHFPLFLLGDSR